MFAGPFLDGGETGKGEDHDLLVEDNLWASEAPGYDFSQLEAPREARNS
jgi:hypothetical protein